MTAFEALCNRAAAIRREIRDAFKAAGVPYAEVGESMGVSFALNLLAVQIAQMELLPQLEGFEIPRPPEEPVP